MAAAVMTSSKDHAQDAGVILSRHGVVQAFPLPAGLAPQQVCETYFSACRDNKPDVWLASLHPDARSNPSTELPGPFGCFNWELQRAMVEKYKVVYKFARVAKEYMRDATPVLELVYVAFYGDVPGYVEGSPLTEAGELRLELEKVSNEWRVVHTKLF